LFGLTDELDHAGRATTSTAHSTSGVLLAHDDPGGVMMDAARAMEILLQALMAPTAADNALLEGDDDESSEFSDSSR
jgi:hypothetical protein